MILGDLNFHGNFVRPSGVTVIETAAAAAAAVEFRFIY